MITTQTRQFAPPSPKRKEIFPVQTFCPFTYAALRALSLCNCPEAANPAAAPPLSAPTRTAVKRPHRNEDALREAVAAQLKLHPHDQILEVGFGTGDTLGALLARAPQGRVIGVESSLALVTQVARRHQFSIKAGRLELEQADVEALPYEYARFHKVLVATDYVAWKNPEPCLNELQRVLQAGGQLVIGLPLKTRWHWAGFTLEEAQEAAGLVRWVGFQEVNLTQGEGWACVTATR
jgi:SAM-dependent methyltransferase